MLKNKNLKKVLSLLVASTSLLAYALPLTASALWLGKTDFYDQNVGTNDGSSGYVVYRDGEFDGATPQIQPSFDARSIKGGSNPVIAEENLTFGRTYHAISWGGKAWNFVGSKLYDADDDYKLGKIDLGMNMEDACVSLKVALDFNKYTEYNGEQVEWRGKNGLFCNQVDLDRYYIAVGSNVWNGEI